MAISPARERGIAPVSSKDLPVGKSANRQLSIFCINKDLSPDEPAKVSIPRIAAQHFSADTRHFHHLESIYGVSYAGRMNRTELQNLAEERLADGELLFANGRYGAAYYIVGYAVECGLKACIAKLTRAEDFYDKILARKIFTHNLKELADHARLSEVFTQTSKKDQFFAANWAQVGLWSEESRYDAHTQQDAEQLIAAVRDPAHGVMQCIRQYW